MYINYRFVCEEEPKPNESAIEEVPRHDGVRGWKKLKQLGKGGFGVVFLAEGRSQFRFALKEIGDDGKYVKGEVEALMKLNHDNIVKCWGYFLTTKRMFIYLELMKESIADLMKKRSTKRCTEAEARKYTKDIVKGISYLHSTKIGLIHRDIKCANVLLDKDGKAKLADMGLAKEHLEKTVAHCSHASNINQYCSGTRAWMSPEARDGQSKSRRADVWSLGCTVLEMLLGTNDFAWWSWRAKLPREYQEKVETLSQNARMKDFLRKIFVPLAQRPDVEAIRNHRWLTETANGINYGLGSSVACVSLLLLLAGAMWNLVTNQ